MTAALRISVILPVLDEGRRISQTLVQLQALPGLHECIVVDGGSTDDTVAQVARHPSVRSHHAARGRAQQMNAGAEIATGDVLLFLHADVVLPDDAARCVADTMADPANVAGAFRTWTVADGPAPWWSPLMHLADMRSRLSSLPYGDQAMFVRARDFHALGGFAALPLMEDLDLSQRLSRVGRIHTVPQRVLVSGRRFLARPLFYLGVMNTFPLLYRLGVPPHTLAALYGHIR